MGQLHGIVPLGKTSVLLQVPSTDSAVTATAVKMKILMLMTLQVCSESFLLGMPIHSHRWEKLKRGDFSQSTQLTLIKQFNLVFPLSKVMKDKEKRQKKTNHPLHSVCL